jgi:hypothetical protein
MTEFRTILPKFQGSAKTVAKFSRVGWKFSVIEYASRGFFNDVRNIQKIGKRTTKETSSKSVRSIAQ